MKALLVMTLLLLPPAARAQNTDIARLQSTCLPTAPLSTLRAVVQVESGGNPNAMQIDFPKALLKRWKLPEGTLRLKRQPTNQREALDWLAYLQSYDIFVDLGLMQVSTAEAKRRGISPESLLEPCTNLRVGWQILEDDYRIETKDLWTRPGSPAARNFTLQHRRYAARHCQRLFRPRPCSSPQTASRATDGEAMSVLSSERPHDQGVEHSMANNRWNDAPALPATQTIDNASNGRQCQIDSAASVGNCKYGRHEEHDESLKCSFRMQLSPYKEKAVIHQAAKEKLFCYWRDEYRPQHFSCAAPLHRQADSISSHRPRTARRG